MLTNSFKLLKVWSPFCIPGFQDRMIVEDRQLSSINRPAFLRDDYIEMMIRGNDSPAMMAHDYTHESTEEDPRMIAFFDSLIRREREEFTTNDTLEDDDSDSDVGTQYLRLTDSEHSASNSGSEDDIRLHGGRASTLSRSAWTESRSEVAEDPNTETVILFGRRVVNRSSERPSNGELGLRQVNGRYSLSPSDSSSSSATSSSGNSDSSHEITVSSDRDNDTAIPSDHGSSTQILTSNSNIELTVTGCVASTSTSIGLSVNIDTSESEQQSLKSLYRLRQLRKRVQLDDADECNLLPKKTCRILSSNIEDRRTLVSAQTDCQVSDRDTSRNNSVKVDDDTTEDTDGCDKHSAAVCQRTVSNGLSETTTCCDLTENIEAADGPRGTVVNNVNTNDDSDSKLTTSAGYVNFNNQSSISPRNLDAAQFKSIN